MDDSRHEAAGLPDSVARPARDPGALPADFVPLRLVLQPSGVALELTRPDMVLGRHSEADVRLPLPDVSRRHCQFTFHAGAWHVRDLKSLNGTFVNGQPVEEAPVCHGDTLRVGGFTFAVDLAGGAADGTLRQPDIDALLRLTRALGPASPKRQAS